MAKGKGQLANEAGHGRDLAAGSHLRVALCDLLLA